MDYEMARRIERQLNAIRQGIVTLLSLLIFGGALFAGIAGMIHRGETVHWYHVIFWAVFAGFISYSVTKRLEVEDR